MNENVENLVLEQLKAMRGEMSEMRQEMNAKFDAVGQRLDNVETGVQSLQGVIIGLGHYMNAMDRRVEHIEEKLGIET